MTVRDQQAMAPTLYSYIVASDTGFAPNPFHGFCTLACCKPKIRTLNGAQEGDYVVGIGPQCLGNPLVYAMRVTQKLTFNEYWNDSQFRAKRPDMSARGIETLGDNIYHWDTDRNEYRQVWSRHSNSDGTENLKNKHHDTKGDDHYVLISNDFIYWGDLNQALPDEFRKLVLKGSNHRSTSNDRYVPAFEKWFKDRRATEDGRMGMPLDWEEDGDTPPCIPHRPRKKC